MKRDLRFEAVYPYPPERVWRALTDPAEMAQWLMPNDFEARIGHRFEFRTKPAPGFDGIVRCEVTEMEIPKRLSYTWVGGKLESVVTFTLQPVSEGTRVVLEHKGFSGAGEFMLSALLGKGWTRMLEERLPKLLSGTSEAVAVIASSECQPGSVSALIDRYEKGSKVFMEVLRSAPGEEIDRRNEGQWGVRETALHIVDAELVGAVRLRMLAAQPGATLAAYQGDVWGRELHYSELPLGPALELFVRLRETTTSVLRQLAAGSWSNRGVHQESGEVTLESYLLSHCEHTEAHLDEIQQMLHRSVSA